jgi:hypothetical protein
MKFKGKSAQMEMIGLVVIVILITLGMLFLAIFSLKDSQEEKIFTRGLLASSTMSAILKTSIRLEAQCLRTETPLELGGEILEDCANNYQTRGNLAACEPFCKYRCDNKHSCDFLEEEIRVLLDNTLGAWHKKYEFRSTLISQVGNQLEEPLITINEGECVNADAVDSSKPFPLPLEGFGLIESELKLCN